jgi:hypothetical protein
MSWYLAWVLRQVIITANKVLSLKLNLVQKGMKLSLVLTRMKLSLIRTRWNLGNVLDV